MPQVEIKLRVWDGKEMSFFDSVDIHDWDTNDFMELQNLVNGKKAVQVLRYTNLKAKGGKEIFEGDIVKVKGMLAFEVMELEGGWRMVNRLRTYDLWDYMEDQSSPCEVIGNIYQNIEKMEEGI